jgi:prolyl-tRNA editing enzyme YbaK/EbsC (Cys-tRNA(Pro) deacylase)
MLSKSAQTIQDFLSAQNIPAQVIELPDSTRTADDAAKAIGCRPAQIVKSLIFKTKHTHKPILVLASGPNRVNEKLIAQAVNEEITKADADFVREKTGFAIGGIPPLGHKEKIETYIDADLLTHEILWAAAGTPHAVFSIYSTFLQSLTQGIILSIKL